MDVGLAEFIRTESGHKVLTARDAGLLGHDDGRVFAYARKHDLILFTLDNDFRRLRDFPIRNSAGVFVFTGSPEAVQNAVTHVVGIVGSLRDEWRNTLVRVSDPHTWSIHAWIREAGVIDRLRVRFDCEQTQFECFPEPGQAHEEDLLMRWAMIPPA